MTEIPTNVEEPLQRIEERLRELNGEIAHDDPNALSMTLVFVVPLHAGTYGPWFHADANDEKCSAKLQSNDLGDDLDATCSRFFQDADIFQEHLEDLLHKKNPKLRYVRPLFLRVPDTTSLAVEVASFLPLLRQSTFLAS